MCVARRSVMPPLMETPSGGVTLLVAAPARNGAGGSSAARAESARVIVVRTPAVSKNFRRTRSSGKRDEGEAKFYVEDRQRRQRAITDSALTHAWGVCRGRLAGRDLHGDRRGKPAMAHEYKASPSTRAGARE